MKTIKLSNEKYVLKTEKKDTSSNYGLLVHIYKKGESTPISGTYLNNNTSKNILIQFAEQQIIRYEQQHNFLF